MTTKPKKTDLIPEPIPSTPTAPTLETSDLYLAAAYSAMGAELVTTERRDRGRVFFIFLGVKPEWRTAWASMTLMINAQMFTASIRNLKCLVHE